MVSALMPSLESDIRGFQASSGRPPRLDVILVGTDPASQVYIKNKRVAAERLGFTQRLHLFPDSASPKEVFDLVCQLNANDAVDGILIQRPLPSGFDLREVCRWIRPAKDVDAFHPELLGELALGHPQLVPCTPSGVMALLNYYQISVAGKRACVVGRSPIVGKPLAYLLLNADATLIQCHRRTPDLAALTQQADLLIVAAGIPGLIGLEHVKPGAVVIDIGVHRQPDGSLCGDVRFDEVSGVASAITPVPGGVGPLTIHMLMRNTVSAAQARLDTARRSGIGENSHVT
ncbi:MAG: hypothetical protein RJB38_2001 [Pseudomonadota bacterium]